MTKKKTSAKYHKRNIFIVKCAIFYSWKVYIVLTVIVVVEELYGPLIEVLMNKFNKGDQSPRKHVTETSGIKNPFLTQYP